MNHIVAISRQDNLSVLATTIRRAHAGVMLAATNLVERALAAGDALIAAKKAIGHGHWLSWLEIECDLSSRQAERYMAVARGDRATLEANSTRVSNLSLRGALKLLPSKKIPRARGISDGKAQKLTRHNALAWFGTAPVVEHQHLFDGLGSRVVTAAIPPDWNMRLASAGESVGQITVPQRDATIRGMHSDDANAVESTWNALKPSHQPVAKRLIKQFSEAPIGVQEHFFAWTRELMSDDIVAVSDDGLDIPASLQRAAPTRFIERDE